MGSTKDCLDFVIDEIRDKDLVKFKKMFGEYAIYYDEKVVALICDNELYIKSTKKGLELARENNLDLTPPFPGAKDWILMSEEIENIDLLNEIIEITREELEKKNK